MRKFEAPEPKRPALLPTDELLPNEPALSAPTATIADERKNACDDECAPEHGRVARARRTRKRGCHAGADQDDGAENQTVPPPRPVRLAVTRHAGERERDTDDQRCRNDSRHEGRRALPAIVGEDEERGDDHDGRRQTAARVGEHEGDEPHEGKERPR